MDGFADRRARALTGMLWGTALGDALGLPLEGLTAAQIARRGARVDRGLASRAFVSDDTEQSALLLESLIAGRGEPEPTRLGFRRALRGWFLRLPFGVGLATLRACLRIVLGLERSGVWSAGNGAAMRAGVIGVYHADDAARRRAVAEACARVTHIDPRAVEGAVFVAELAAACAAASGKSRGALAREAARVVQEPELRAALAHALDGGSALPHNTGFVVHTLALCVRVFVQHGDSPLAGVRAAILPGGDTDTAGAIVGGWLGALHGPEAIPRDLLDQVDDGPFGPSHLAALALASADQPVPAWSRARAMARNLAVWPVVMAHVLDRLRRGELFV